MLPFKRSGPPNRPIINPRHFTLIYPHWAELSAPVTTVLRPLPLSLHVCDCVMPRAAKKFMLTYVEVL